MKQVVAFGSIILLITACTPQTPPPARATNPVAFDGHYQRPVLGAKTPGCPDLQTIPFVTISSGVAALQAPNFYFQGSVTPDGALSMHSSSGQTFVGHIDSNYVLSADVGGQQCSYHIAWTRVPQ